MGTKFGACFHSETPHDVAKMGILDAFTRAVPLNLRLPRVIERVLTVTQIRQQSKVQKVLHYTWMAVRINKPLC